jgi:hypothetical protein
LIINHGNEIVEHVSPILEVIRIEGDAHVKPTSTTLVVIRVTDAYRTRDIKIPYMALQKTDMFLEYLSKHMVFVKDDFGILLQRYLHGEVRYLQMNCGTILYYDELGWQKLGDSNKTEFILNSYSTAMDRFQYRDDTLSFQNGTLSGQVDFIKSEILPYKETRLAMALGLASIIAGYTEEYTGIGSLIVNVSGKSSTGKSTITELAGSFFATPKLSNNGIVRGFNATKNAILSASEGRKGLPILLDDLNANRSEHNKRDLIYQLASNESRARCQNTGDLQEARSGWSGLVIITSETPMFDDEKVPQGVNARVINLADIVWTQDATHSERIKSGVRNNYGHFGLEFAKIVQKLGVKTILKLQKDAQNDIVNKFKEKDELADRIASKLAVIKVTADLLKQHFFKNFNADGVVKDLVKAYDNTMKTRAIEETALEDLKNYLIMNKKHFDVHIEKSAKEHQGELYGAIIINKKEQTINVLKPIFDKFCKEKQIEEKLRIVKYWAEKGYIKTDKDHNYVKVGALGNVRALKIHLKYDELKFFQGDLYEPHCHNCGEALTTTFGSTKQETPIYTYDYDDNFSIEDFMKEGTSTNED